MVSLQHLALDAHIASGARYDGNNTVIENVIFEVDQKKDQLLVEIADLCDEYKSIQKTKNKKAAKNTSEMFDDIVFEISSKLFDSLTYSDIIHTNDEVDWKEYFHCVYDCVVPDENTPYNHGLWDVLPEQPKELDDDSPCKTIINDIKEGFEKLKSEGGKLESISTILQTQRFMGGQLIDIKRRIASRERSLDIYYKILNWSMN